MISCIYSICSSPVTHLCFLPYALHTIHQCAFCLWMSKVSPIPFIPCLVYDRSIHWQNKDKWVRVWKPVSHHRDGMRKKKYRRMWLTTVRWQETRNESSKLLLLSKVSYSPSSWLESVWHEAEPCLWGTERPVMSFRWKSVRHCYLASI